MRIVSLVPAATEIAAALGLHEQLVGISHACDFPPEIVDKPRVTRCLVDTLSLSSAEIDQQISETIKTRGTLYALDEELLRLLNPDLILTQRLCDVCAVGYGSVAQMAAGLPSRPRVLNLEPACLGDVFEEIRIVANATDRASEGEQIVCALERRVQFVRARAQSVAHRPRCYLMEWIDPPFCAGHWNPELVDIAGGEEPIGRRGEDSVRIDWKAVVDARPEVVVLACCGYSVERTLRDVPVLKTYDQWQTLPAVRNERVFVVDGNAYFTRPGPRLVESTEILAGILHPELFDKFAVTRWPPGHVSVCR